MFYTDRLMIRALDPDADSKQMTKYLNDPHYLLAIAADCPKPTRGGDVRDFMTREMTKPTSFPHYAVCLKPPPEQMPDALPEDEDLFVTKDGKSRYPLIGMLIFHKMEFSWTNKAMAFGIIFDKKFCNQGYGSETLRWACRYVFESMGMHRFELRTRTDNIGAIKCYEKVGFKKEGVSRESYFCDGEWRDQMTMALLEHEWRDLVRKQ